MTFRGLAAAVVERLGPELPAAVTASEEPEGFLRIALDESRWEVFPLDEPELVEEIEPGTYDPPYPAFGVLEALDFVHEYVRAELDPAWGDEPWAEQDEEEIRFGLGATAFPPIPLSALGE